MSIIALLTDFGNSDWFTSEIKGVLYTIAPDATIVDISHEISPGDIQCAAFVILVSYKTFPKGTIFCIPIDPDTSVNCLAIAITTDNYTFVAPDNGILSWAIEKERIQSIVNITDMRYFRNPSSMTFRGRDIFAPVTAHLSMGIPAAIMGPSLTSYKRISFPEPDLTDNTFHAKALYIDHFGNIITNINHDLAPKGSSVLIRSSEVNVTLPLFSSYNSVDFGKGIVYTGSTGFIEIGVNSKSAADVFKIKTGDTIDLTFVC